MATELAWLGIIQDFLAQRRIAMPGFRGTRRAPACSFSRKSVAAGMTLSPSIPIPRKCTLLRGEGRHGIFVSPLAKEEIAYLKAPERKVSQQQLLTIMRRKPWRRTRRQKG